jgi:hypothetical protein
MKSTSGDENIMIMNTDQISNTSGTLEESELKLTNLRVKPSHSPSTGSFAHLKKNYNETQSSKNEFIHIEPEGAPSS